jgi:O6-methylguanine-DNA--protein-cysteine methyltransferase
MMLGAETQPNTPPSVRTTNVEANPKESVTAPGRSNPVPLSLGVFSFNLRVVNAITTIPIGTFTKKIDLQP